MNSDLVISDTIGGIALDIEKVNTDIPDKTCGCYASYCDKTNMYYIGSSTDCRQRKSSHIGDMKRKMHANPRMKEDAKKYGTDSFHFFILEKCNPELLVETERRWYKIIGKNRLYNAGRKVTRPNRTQVETQMKHGREAKKYALLLMKQGLPYKEVSDKTGMKQAYLRVLNKRQKDMELEGVSPEYETLDFVSNETIIDETANDKHVSSPSYKALELEAVFYATTAAACYGFVTALPGVIGWALAAVYALLCFNSLQMAKNEDIPETAEHGKNRIWALELVAVFAHYFTVNRALWSNLDALPFDVKYVPKGGTWILNNGEKINGIWQGGEIIFYLSCTVAVLLSAAAIEAVSTRLKLTKEQKNK